MEFTRSRSGILVNRRKYIFYLRKEIGLLGCRVVETPIKQNLKLEVVEKEIKEKEKYQRFVGRLTYLDHTRPDIAFAVNT